MKTYRIALIGAGVMGANHARALSQCSRAALDVIIDDDLDRANHLAGRYGARGSDVVESALGCDAAIVATSTPSHFSIATPLLEAGIPVLVEKPLSMSLEESEAMCRQALRLGVPLVCGFVERFNPVIGAAMDLLVDDVTHIVTMRHSPVNPRATGSVVYDLLIHDIDLVRHMVGSNIVVKAGATSWTPEGHPWSEIADCNLQFASGAIATLSASRAGQRKLRGIQVFTPKLLVDLDLLRADVTVYRNVMQEQPDDTRALTFRAETIIDIPFVRHAGEPLALQLDHFLQLIDDPSGLPDELEGVMATHLITKEIEQACQSEAAAESMKASLR